MSRLFNDIENDVIMYMFFICWFNYIFSFRHKAGLLTSACSVWNLHTTMHKYIFTQGGNTHKVWSTEMFLHAIINKNYHHTIDRRGLQLCISTFTQICLTWKNICIILMYWLLLCTWYHQGGSSFYFKVNVCNYHSGRYKEISLGI